MISTLNVDEVAAEAFDEATKFSCDDISIRATDSSVSLTRFSNNSITLVNTVHNLFLGVYLGRDKKRIVGATSALEKVQIREFLAGLVSSSRILPSSEDYTPLPSGTKLHERDANYDPNVVDMAQSEHVKEAIDSAILSGATRVSGSLNVQVQNSVIMTSAGSRGHERGTEILLNVRAFGDHGSSGHGLSCSSFLLDFNPKGCGSTAGDYSKRSENATSLPEGKYDIIFTPTVVANILPIGVQASAFLIDSGTSVFVDQLDKKVASRDLNVDDYGVYDHGLGGNLIDDEGVPTQKTSIIRSGVFNGIVHNCTTARKFGTKSTGNAGIIAPGPHCIVFGSGDSTLGEMIKETKNGLFITNNWYTRFQNARLGEYSTVPRDAAFRIQDGEIKNPISGIRLSDSIPRQLEGIKMISKERQWIKWWEVGTPTLAPWMLIEAVPVTRAVGS